MKLYRLIIEVYAGDATFGDYLYLTAEPGQECEVAMNEFLECYMPFDAEDRENAEAYATLKEKFRQLQDGKITHVDYGELWDDRTFKVYKPWPVKPAELQYDGKGNATVRIEIYPWQTVDWPLGEIAGAELELAPDAHLEAAYEDRTYIEEP